MSGWIVSNAAGDKFRCWDSFGPAWTENRELATRYARRVDAESAHANDEDAWRIVEFDPPRRVRHKKRGSTYEVLGEAEAQVTIDSAGRPFGLGRIRVRDIFEGDKLIVYRGANGKLWLRFPDEFDDGRFEEISNGDHGRHDISTLLQNALESVKALEELAAHNEAEFTGWGDQIVPPGAEFMRVKSGQALKALQELAIMRSKKS